MTKTALIIGGGYSLQDDLARLSIPYDIVVACNDAGTIWPGRLDAWVSLHPNKFNSWVKAREANGRAPCPDLVGYNKTAINGPPYRTAGHLFPGQTKPGSSGLFAAKYALIDMGIERAVLCGIPLDPGPHYFDDAKWHGYVNFRPGALEVQRLYGTRIRSMSGWTRVLFGPPADWELSNGPRTS